MKLAIMQPYLLPYIGYFQLMGAVDGFILYDNIQYTKKGWINRNRILLNGKEHLFTVPLKNDSDYLNIKERSLSDNSPKEINKILNQIKSAYSKAPYFKSAFPLVERIFLYQHTNLFEYIFNSIIEIKKFLDIQTTLYISSDIGIDHSLKGKYKVISFCHKLNADIYINPIGGVELYDKEEFIKNGVTLMFHRLKEIEYSQGIEVFEKSLSIIDVIMFNSIQQVKDLLKEYILD